MSLHRSNSRILPGCLCFALLASLTVVPGCGGGPSSSPSSGSSASGGHASGSGGAASPGSSSSGSLLTGPLSTVNAHGWIRGFAYNPATNTMYAVVPAWGTSANASVGQLTSSPNGSLLVIDGTTGNIAASVSVPPVSPAQYAFTGQVTVDPASNRAYISDETDNQVIAVDGATNTIVARIAVGNQPAGIAADPSTGMVYVANSRDRTVSAIAETTNTVTATIPVGLGGTVADRTGFAESVTIDPALGLVYVADSHDTSLVVISENTSQVQAVWKVAQYPNALLFDPSNHTLYVADYSESTVAALDATTGAVRATISTASGPASLGLDPATNTLYVSVNGGANILAIDTQTNSVLGESPLIGPASSYAVGVNSITHVVGVPVGLDYLAYYQGIVR